MYYPLLYIKGTPGEKRQLAEGFVHSFRATDKIPIKGLW